MTDPITMLIDDLLTQREDKTLDFKRDLSSMKGVLKDIVAFANTAGGTIVVGVADDRTVVGVEDFDKAEEQLVSAVADSITPQILVNPRSTSRDGKELMLVEVVQAVQRPVHLKSKGEEEGSYVRIGSESWIADPARLEELRNFHASRTWDERPCPGAQRADFDDGLAARTFTRRGEEYSEGLMRTHRLLVDGNLGLTPSRAGVILFARDAREHFPDARFRCTTYPGTQKGGEMTDPVDFDGRTVLQALDDVVAYIRQHTGLRTRTEGMDRVEFPQYSIRMLREILHNAIGHADYNMPGRRLNVSIYSDHIEIENPGTFPLGMTVQDLKAGVSQTRNRAIASTLHRLRYMEERGSAYARMRSEMEKGYPEPEWIEVGPMMRVILRPHPDFEAQPTISGVTSRLAPTRSRKSTAERRAEILVVLAGRELGTREISEAINLRDRQTRRLLTAMESEGLVLATDEAETSPQRKYRLP